MRQTRKVQWADESGVEYRKTSSSDSESQMKTLKSSTLKKKLVQIRNYSGYAETHAIEKIVQIPANLHKNKKFDRNLSTVLEEDDASERSDEN